MGISARSALVGCAQLDQAQIVEPGGTGDSAGVEPKPRADLHLRAVARIEDAGQVAPARVPGRRRPYFEPTEHREVGACSALLSKPDVPGPGPSAEQIARVRLHTDGLHQIDIIVGVQRLKAHRIVAVPTGAGLEGRRAGVVPPRSRGSAQRNAEPSLTAVRSRHPSGLNAP